MSAPTEPLTVSFVVAAEHAPVLRSMLEELSDTLALRLAAGTQASFKVEAALTRASLVAGVMRAAVFPRVPRGDPDYPKQRHHSPRNG